MEGSGRPERVLVVEDDERSRRLARAALEIGAMSVEVAADGTSALAACARAEFDAVLLDIQLPDLDGPSVLARLRADDRTAGLLVVALTAFAMAGDRERLLALGFDGYLTKPIEVPTFADSVRNILLAHRAA